MQQATSTRTWKRAMNISSTRLKIEESPVWFGPRVHGRDCLSPLWTPDCLPTNPLSFGADNGSIALKCVLWDVVWPLWVGGSGVFSVLNDVSQGLIRAATLFVVLQICSAQVDTRPEKGTEVEGGLHEWGCATAVTEDVKSLFCPSHEQRMLC